jgi:hypothetical protein
VKFSSGVTIILLGLFMWLAWRGNLFQVVHTWDSSTWALVALAALLGWVSRNEFGGL